MFSLGASIKTYKLDFSLFGHKDAILCVAMSGNGDLFASGGKKMTISNVWEYTTVDCYLQT